MTTVDPGLLPFFGGDRELQRESRIDTRRSQVLISRSGFKLPTGKIGSHFFETKM